MTERARPLIDRSIYPMPMFAQLVAEDLASTERVYAAAGFVRLATISGPEGTPALLHLRREKYQDILVTPGTAAPGSTSVSFAAGDVDLAEVAEHLRAAGADVKGPYDTQWFTTDVAFTDHDGHTTLLTAPRAADRSQAQAWAGSQIAGDFGIPDGFSDSADRP